MEYCKKCGGKKGLCLGARGRCNCSDYAALACSIEHCSVLASRIAQLEAALREIRDCSTDTEAREIAKKALEDKGDE